MAAGRTGQRPSSFLSELDPKEAGPPGPFSQRIAVTGILIAAFSSGLS